MVSSVCTRYLLKAASFFSLPVLDTRLQAPSDQKKKQKIQNKAGKDRWSTLEFRFYWVCFLIVVPLLYKAAIDASSSSNPNYVKYERLLSQGWLFGRKVDNSDSQYRFFRENVFILSIVLSGHIGLRKLIYFTFPKIKRNQFDVGFGLIFLFVVHGINAIKVFLHIVVMLAITRLFKNKFKLTLLLLWSYGIVSLFINDKYRNYRIGHLFESLSFLDPGFKGIVARWDVFYNFTLLRSLSFNLDYLSRYNEEQKKYLKKDEERDSNSGSIDSLTTELIMEERERMNATLNLEAYSFFNYIAYLTYAPLFIAGPILTFNDFYVQSIRTLPSINTKRNLIFGLRFLFCLLVMEFLLHFIYVVAISKTGAWENDTPFQISMIGLFNLNIVWLKLLIPWRFFRLWSLLDGIDPPENMIRCMDNNYSALAFWKGWHRSYNKWVVKYIYIPLGGSSNRILASLAVFTFVAIWHDIELKLLVWGWLIVLFLIPEYFLSGYFRKNHSEKWWYRHLCAAGGVLNIWLMMIANLYGFCLGHSGTSSFLKEIFGTIEGLKFFVVANIALFIAVQVMFELREDEKRRGIDVKC
ncbi:hypothetical protein WICMUC_004104 [Wickerhamomyces mucosus]|uniref:Glycerol uptake protein 1 n=1 Tax=Wickerhamomyces mucosus TaxID=1378264 RepID=A0A9P8PI69_9ASCO|nr:hypothetical protein WICMUC_004104 [Wickerhamomyces mucosus]